MFNKDMTRLTSVKPNFGNRINMGFFAKSIIFKPNFLVKHSEFSQNLQYRPIFSFKEITKKIQQKIFSKTAMKTESVPPLRTEDFFVLGSEGYNVTISASKLLRAILTANGNIDSICKQIKENYKNLGYADLNCLKRLFHELVKNEYFYNKSAIYLRVPPCITMIENGKVVYRDEPIDIDITDPRLIDAIRFIGANVSQAYIKYKWNTDGGPELEKKIANLTKSWEEQGVKAMIDYDYTPKPK